jgi:hypothetical protein
VPLKSPVLVWVSALIAMTGGGWQPVHAQVTTAELGGLVKDPSANAVPGAEVRAQSWILDSPEWRKLLNVAPTVFWA